MSALSLSLTTASLIFCRGDVRRRRRASVHHRNRSNETPAVNSSIRRMEVKMSRRDWSGVLEDKLSLTVEIALDLFLQAISIA